MLELDGWEVPVLICDVCKNPLKYHWRERKCFAVMAELEDAPDLSPGVVRREGSTPSNRTNIEE